MARRPIALLLACGLMSLALVVAGLPANEVAAANKSDKGNKKPIRNPKYDPTARKVDLFDGMKDGDLDVRLIPKDSKQGVVLIENKTDKPLTVKLPEAVVAVPVNAQFGGGGMGGGGMGGMMGGGGMGGMGGGGGMQSMGGGMGGGGMGGMGGGGMGGMGGGGGFFSIPPEKVVSLTMNSVCLEHGKQEPNSRAKYRLVPVAKFNDDPVLFQLLSKVGTGQVDSQAAQAAAWHLTNKMSFQDLANKTNETLDGSEPTPYFSSEQLLGARELLASAAGLAADAEENSSKDKSEDSSEEGTRAPVSRVSQDQGN